MRFFRLLKTDLYRAVFQFRFLMAVLVLACLCFTSEGYYTQDTSISVLELALFYTRDELANQMMISGYHLFRSGLGTYVVTFLPILAAIPAIPNFCRERSNGYLRFLVPRCNVSQRCLSMQLSTMLTGGLVTLLGYGLYGVLCLILFPRVTQDQLQWIAGPVWCSVVGYLIGAAVMGMAATILAVLLLSVSKNPYFVLCTAFACFYAYNVVLNQLVEIFFSNGQEALDLFTVRLYLSQIIYVFAGSSPPWILAMWGGVAVLVFCLLRLTFGRRLDKGA